MIRLQQLPHHWGFLVLCFFLSDDSLIARLCLNAWVRMCFDLFCSWACALGAFYIPYQVESLSQLFFHTCRVCDSSCFTVPGPKHQMSDLNVKTGWSKSRHFPFLSSQKEGWEDEPVLTFWSKVWRFRPRAVPWCCYFVSTLIAGYTNKLSTFEFLWSDCLLCFSILWKESARFSALPVRFKHACLQMSLACTFSFGRFPSTKVTWQLTVSLLFQRWRTRKGQG